MPLSANPDSFNPPPALSFHWDFEIVSPAEPSPFQLPSPAAKTTATNQRPSFPLSGLSAPASGFSNGASRAPTFDNRSSLHESINHDSLTSAVAAALTLAPIHSPFVGSSDNRESDAEADRDRARDTNSDGSQRYCEVICPVIVSEVRGILRLSGGSGSIGDRLSIPSEREAIQSGDFPSYRSVPDVVFRPKSHCGSIVGFFKFSSLVRLEIPSSVEAICVEDFRGCAHLTDVIFEDGNHLRQIDGFIDCTSLSRIFIPSSVELLSWDAFRGCAQLREVIYEANSHLREVQGFGNCDSLSRMVLPPSLQVIHDWAFGGCAGPRVVEFPFGSRLRHPSRLRHCHCLIEYRDLDLKNSRRGLHLGLGLSGVRRSE
jgi:hypothetical protein